jgi:nucleotide-binding universal stress UspA family protein
MDYKDILVHIDNTAQCATRLKLALKLARKCDAYLTGICVVTHPHYTPSVAGIETTLAKAEAVFRQHAADSGVDAEWLAVDWPVAGADMAEIINLYAHKKDLVIVGQGEPGGSKSDLPPDLAERVVKGAGRPVLVVPYAGTFSEIGERVILAWKDGRASARALGDAMPLLRRAKQVCVLTIEAAKEAPPIDLAPHGIITHLERHRINLIRENLVTGEIPVANTLMAYAWENGCDLIVMGAYAHAQNGLLAVGPVAKELFERMTVPVLMSH